MQNNNKYNNNAFPNNKNSFDGDVSDNGYVYSNLPQGLASEFKQNAAAITAYNNMSDEKKRMVLDMASKVTNKKQMHELAQNIASNNF